MGGCSVFGIYVYNMCVKMLILCNTQHADIKEFNEVSSQCKREILFLKKSRHSQGYRVKRFYSPQILENFIY